MRHSLPEIHKKSRSVFDSADEDFRERDRWRTVHRVCGSAIGHDGYLKMLQGVRKKFLQRVTYNPVDQLPRIMHLRPPLGATTLADGINALRFSEGLRFKRENGHVTPRAAHAEVHQTPLSVLEAEERKYLMDTELWERRVLHQMMVVSYVTFVLREELDELQYCECEERSNIRYDEEKERYWLQNESEASKGVERCKAAVRAKKEKQRRLEEADVLYPLSKSAHTSLVYQERQKEPDARLILQRYVRLKHGPDSALACTPSPEKQTQPFQQGERRRGVLPPLAPQTLPAPRTLVRSALRNALGIADYVVLLEKDVEARGIIEECERKEFESILSLFWEQILLIRTWKYKRMHLKRLLYWKGQREERRQKIQTALEKHAMKRMPQFSSEHDACMGLEKEGRVRISIEESNCRELMRKVCGEEHMRAKVGALFAEYEESRTYIEKDEAVARQLWVQDLELALRMSLTKEREETMSVIVPTQISLLQFLYQQQGAHSSQILKIQRTFRRWKEGRFGWRITHREVGRIIQAGRDARKIQRGMESLRSFKASLLADCRAIKDEILAIQGAERADVLEKEFMHRVVINSQEEWEIAALLRANRQNIVDNIILPKKSQCIHEEMDQRREVDVGEEFERNRLYPVFYRGLSVIKEKAMMKEQEEAGRVLITLDEAESFRNVCDLELDEREILRIEALEREEKREEERHLLFMSFLESKYESQQEHAQKIFQLMCRCKEGAIEIEATDPSIRNGLLEGYLAGCLPLLEEASLHCHREYAAALRRDYCHTIYNSCVDFLVGSEELARHRVLQTEREVVLGIVNEMRRETGEQLRRLQEETRAANVIKNFYRRYKNGEVGRTGMRRFLREALAEKREKLELAQIHKSQRRDIQRYRDILEEEIRLAYLEKQRAIEFKMQVLEYKTEPWARAELEKMERMMFEILLSNCSSIDSTSLADPTTVLQQMESHERVSIVREWQTAFAKVFEPRKSTFRLEIMACKLQRFWCRYSARKRQLFFVKECMQQLLREEARRRAELELLEMEGRVCEVLKPMEGCALLRGYLINVVPFFLEHICFDISLEVGIFEDEWRNRMLLLWRMRHSAFESAVAREEAAEREEMESFCFYAGVEQLQLVEDETALRDALWNERVYFLLRMLVKAERELRVLIRVEFRKELVEATECEARGDIYKAEYTTLMDILFVQLASPIAASITEEEARERETIMGLFEENKPPLTTPPDEKDEKHVSNTETSYTVDITTDAMACTEGVAPATEQPVDQYRELEEMEAAAVATAETGPDAQTVGTETAELDDLRDENVDGVEDVEM
ncbi:hypothetical protein MOQ_003026 [Trypanosoma cruzi marinkellei]|uniref:Uncharacterized protein n=1 Tax=Trypanosoma cruzi marinkellei TaxID=85056 RepID=K2NW55_TRYCR|nr:hypothetical protein MOQ_003026 [Trypanosoma cruzi marinkellei]